MAFVDTCLTSSISNRKWSFITIVVLNFGDIILDVRFGYYVQGTILDINYIDFLQFQRYFIPQAELEEAFIYIIHKPIDFSIDFSYRLKDLRSYGHWLETSKSANRDLVPIPNSKKSFIIPVRGNRPNISTFGTFAKQGFSASFHDCSNVLFMVVERLARFSTSPLLTDLLVIRFRELELTVSSKYNPMYVTLTFTSPIQNTDTTTDHK